MIETSNFGYKFCAMKTAINMIEGLCYKLQMMGIPLIGSTSVFCDNESVVKNSTAPESSLKKRYTMQLLTTMQGKHRWRKSSALLGKAGTHRLLIFSRNRCQGQG
jgi:hypothetical protein